MLATFVQQHQLDETGEYEGTGWIYPGGVRYRDEPFLRSRRRLDLPGRFSPGFIRGRLGSRSPIPQISFPRPAPTFISQAPSFAHRNCFQK